MTGALVAHPGSCETPGAVSGAKTDHQIDGTNSRNTQAWLQELDLSLYVAPVETDVKLAL